MKKSLLLVALLGTVGAAAAQTNVTLYGTVDAGVAYTNGVSPSGKTLSLESGQQSYSRLGFKGTEDLGGGVKAMFVLEQGILIDTGDTSVSTLGSGIAPITNSGTFSSQAYVGLISDKFGSVKAGRVFTPLYEAHAAIDPFMSGFAANINNFFGTDAMNQSNYQRMNNAVSYSMPDNLWGFKGSVAYGFGEVAGATSEFSQFGLSLGYENGPLTIAYAYHHSNAQDLFYVGPLGNDAPFKTNFLGAAYNFGVAKVHGAIDQNQQGSSFKTQDYMLGVTLPYGAHSFFADYTHKKNKEFDGANASQLGVGYTYTLSKRSNVYAAYTHVKNGANSTVSTVVPGNNVNTFQVGLRHSF